MLSRVISSCPTEASSNTSCSEEDSSASVSNDRQISLANNCCKLFEFAIHGHSLHYLKLKLVLINTVSLRLNLLSAGNFRGIYFTLFFGIPFHLQAVQIHLANGVKLLEA
jgi:hypothetical protein